MSELPQVCEDLFTALEAGRRVLISRYGRVVALVEPYSRVNLELLANYSIPVDPPFGEISAKTIRAGNPSGFIAKVVSRAQPFYVTRNRVVYGVMMPDPAGEVDDGRLDLESSQFVADSVRQHLRDHPGAGPAEVAEYTEALETELSALRRRSATADEPDRATAQIDSLEVLHESFAASDRGDLSLARKLIWRAVLRGEYRGLGAIGSDGSRAAPLAASEDPDEPVREAHGS